MSTVEEIAEAIAGLPKEEFWKLTDRLLEMRDKDWDEQIADDAASGRLDFLWREADAELSADQTIPVDEFLRHSD